MIGWLCLFTPTGHEKPVGSGDWVSRSIIGDGNVGIGSIFLVLGVADVPSTPPVGRILVGPFSLTILGYPLGTGVGRGFSNARRFAQTWVNNSWKGYDSDIDTSTRRTLTRTRAPILNSFTRIVSHW